MPKNISDSDPVLDEFLKFLASDIAKNPDKLKMLDKDFVERLQALVGDLEVDLSKPLT